MGQWQGSPLRSRESPRRTSGDKFRSTQLSRTSIGVAAEDESGAGRPQEGGGERHVPISPGVKRARYTLPRL